MHADDVTLRAEIAVIGGSGFYSFIDEPTAVDIDTPFGAPSGTVSVGAVAGRQVAFLARHGAHHEHPPHRINYRANAWALRSLGVRQVLAPCAVGGLTKALAPGDIETISRVPDPRGCSCAAWADEMELTYELPGGTW